MMSSERRLGWTALVGVVLSLGFGGVLSTTPVIAQPSQEQQSAIRSNCRSDYMSNCSSVKPGGIESLQCLQRNVAKLSPACRTAVNAVSPPPPPPQQATTSSAAVPAPPAAAPPARTMPAATSAPSMALPPKPPVSAPSPPRSARAVTAPPEATPIPASAPTPEQQSAIRFTCRRDFINNCRGVTPGGPEALACLQRNAARLTPDCKTSLAAITEAAPPLSDTTAPAAAAPTGRPVGPLRRAIRERMMDR